MTCRVRLRIGCCRPELERMSVTTKMHLLMPKVLDLRPRAQQTCPLTLHLNSSHLGPAHTSSSASLIPPSCSHRPTSARPPADPCEAASTSLSSWKKALKCRDPANTTSRLSGHPIRFAIINVIAGCRRCVKIVTVTRFRFWRVQVPL